jgi:hypothetical protein
MSFIALSNQLISLSETKTVKTISRFMWLRPPGCRAGETAWTGRAKLCRRDGELSRDAGIREAGNVGGGRDVTMGHEQAFTQKFSG